MARVLRSSVSLVVGVAGSWFWCVPKLVLMSGTVFQGHWLRSPRYLRAGICLLVGRAGLGWACFLGPDNAGCRIAMVLGLVSNPWG